ncbi:MAG: CRTAC1 family protein [Pseudomonadota bacterium]
MENDGDLDIYQTNGWPDWAEFGSFPTDQTRVFESNGDGTFVDSAIPLGLNDTQQGRGIVCADFDNDGDVDVLQLHLDTTLAATLWVNTLNTNNYLKVKLLGAAPNTEAVGARIYATSGGKEQMREVNLGSNFASHNPTVQHFGLGASAQVDTLRIVWPDGSETVQQSVSANQEVIVAQPGS